MTWKGWISALGLLVLAGSWVGCKAPTPRPPYHCPADDIRTGDSLLISLLDVPDADRFVDKILEVRTDGTINIPYLQSVHAAGKTFGQFERQLQTNYIAKGFFRQPTVVVKPGLRFYSVGGEVKAPDRKPYSGDITVVRAIVSCGDFTEFANPRSVIISRTNGDREEVDCVRARHDSRFDRPICPGDAIFVPRSKL
jgi:protein involved in polysaccharide export with SLBB domain